MTHMNWITSTLGSLVLLIALCGNSKLPSSLSSPEPVVAAAVPAKNDSEQDAAPSDQEAPMMDASGEQVGTESEDGMTVKEKTTPNTFRLFDLPAELQLRIFDLAVTEANPVCITYQAWRDFTGKKDSLLAQNEWKFIVSQKRFQPGLTRTSRSVRADSLKAYYNLNDFVAGYCREEPKEGRVVLRWLRAIGSDNRALIGSMTLVDPTFGYSPNTMAKLDQLTTSEDGDFCLYTLKSALGSMQVHISAPLRTDIHYPRRTMTFH